MTTIAASELEDHIGKEVGVSEWMTIAQDRINQFADVTEDHQFIHVDPQRAKETPFGGTIAHGFLTLSLLSGMAEGNTLMLEGCKMGVNYGLEKVRFLAPVGVDKAVRARFTLANAAERAAGVYQIVYDVTVEIQGQDKPALSAQWITLQYI